jgi:hypothetical protein
MNSSDPQGELLPPSAPSEPAPSLQEVRDFFAQEALKSAGEIGQLKRQAEVQRTLLLGTMVALVLLSGSVNLITMKQMRMARDQSNDLSARVIPLYRNFREQQEPAVKRLVSQLQVFADSNREFRPVLERYRPFLQQYFTGPAAPPPTMPPLQAPVQPPRQAPR